MEENPTMILTAEDVRRKTERIAYEILEQHIDENEIVLIGVAPNGTVLAENISAFIKGLSKLKITVSELRINKKTPTLAEVDLTLSDKEVKNKVVILVDDVANSGRTLLYAMKPLLDVELKKLQVAVLVDRMHKSFPVSPDFVGLSLSTNIHEHVTVSYENGPAVYLS